MSGTIYLCFTGEETEAQRSCDLPEVTEELNGSAEMETWALGLPDSALIRNSVRDFALCFLAESFCAAQADGWAFSSLGNGHGLCPHLLGKKISDCTEHCSCKILNCIKTYDI